MRVPCFLRTRPMCAERAGFTLLEILLVIVLIGIVAAIAIPGLGNSSSSHRVIEQARAIHSALAEARARAVAEQRDYRLQLTSGTEYALQYDDGGVWTAHGSPHDLPEGITATIGGGGSGTIVFEPHGRVDTPQSIVVQSGDRAHTIDVLASGLLRWEAGS